MPSLRERWREERADAKEASKELWHWARHDVQYMNLAKRACNFKKPKVWAYWVATLAGIAAIVLLSHYRDTAVEAFEPHKDSIVNAPVSWLAPIGILIVLSFPPLVSRGTEPRTASSCWAGAQATAAWIELTTVCGDCRADMKSSCWLLD